MQQLKVLSLVSHFFPEKNNDFAGSAYGTFLGPSPIVIAPLSYPQEQQTPAVIVIGGCPSCRVCSYLSLIFQFILEYDDDS